MMKKLFINLIIIITILATVTNSQLPTSINPNDEFYEDFNKLANPLFTTSYSNLPSDPSLLEYLDMLNLKKQLIKNHYSSLNSQLKQQQKQLLENIHFPINLRIKPLHLVKRVLADYKRQAILADYKKRSIHHHHIDNEPWINVN
ncbi:hypothetical protein MN116_003162 [Schistosoma mekongi]|uniref:Uncharacterized protein n=1 Tax=Schistosoma mekongi TaxID=38744 RepID=A0AAE2D791_SCHME|nr:hypothetical protein MN116_003162 [Schistosoma mekongi]